MSPIAAIGPLVIACFGNPTPTDDRWAIGTTWHANRGGPAWMLTGYDRDGQARITSGDRVRFRSRATLMRSYRWDQSAGIHPYADFIEWRPIPQNTGETIRWNRLPVPEAK